MVERLLMEGVVLCSADLDRAKAFYGDLLGLPILLAAKSLPNAKMPRGICPRPAVMDLAHRS